MRKLLQLVKLNHYSLRPFSLGRVHRKSEYETLGVSSNVTERELKEAYLQKSKTLHPDTNTGDIESFNELKSAYYSLLPKIKQQERNRRKQADEDDEEFYYSTFDEKTIRERKKLLEVKRSMHSPFLWHNFVEYSLTILICMVMGYIITHVVVRIHPATSYVANMDVSDEAHERRLNVRKRIRELEEEQREWERKKALEKQAKEAGKSV